MPQQLHDCCIGLVRPENFIQELEEPLSGGDFAGFYGSWSEFRPILLSWFLTEDLKNKLFSETGVLISRLNEIQNDGSYANESRELNSKLKYNNSAMENYKILQSRFNLFHESVASIIYERLLGADLIKNS